MSGIKTSELLVKLYSVNGEERLGNITELKLIREKQKADALVITANILVNNSPYYIKVIYGTETLFEGYIEKIVTTTKKNIGGISHICRICALGKENVLYKTEVAPGVKRNISLSGIEKEYLARFGLGFDLEFSSQGEMNILGSTSLYRFINEFSECFIGRKPKLYDSKLYYGKIPAGRYKLGNVRTIELIEDNTKAYEKIHLKNNVNGQYSVKFYGEGRYAEKYLEKLSDESEEYTKAKKTISVTSEDEFINIRPYDIVLLYSFGECEINRAEYLITEKDTIFRCSAKFG